VVRGFVVRPCRFLLRQGIVGFVIVTPVFCPRAVKADDDTKHQAGKKKKEVGYCGIGEHAGIRCGERCLLLWHVCRDILRFRGNVQTKKQGGFNRPALLHSCRLFFSLKSPLQLPI